MRVLHLVVAIVVALVSINNGVAIAAKTTLRSDSNDYTALRGNIASDETDLEERRGGVGGGGRGGGRGGGGGRGVGRGGVGYRPVAGGHGGHGGGGGDEVFTLPPGVYVGPEFGGPHGDDYTDAALVKSGQKVLSINLRAAERVDAVILTIVNPSGEESTLYHGGGGGDLKTPLALAEGEYITVMEAHAGKHKERTRIKYIKFTTNLGNFIEGGTRTDNIGTDTAKDGYQLGGFIGRSGDELDLVSAIWTSIQPVV
ncbi:Jacalin-like lectin domain [Phytophthora cactorum]|nr:Jacalin-like lectin domain [Phytophthora cactorum]